jgi:hypothetical protein
MRIRFDLYLFLFTFVDQTKVTKIRHGNRPETCPCRSWPTRTKAGQFPVRTFRGHQPTGQEARILRKTQD